MGVVGNLRVLKKDLGRRRGDIWVKVLTDIVFHLNSILLLFFCLYFFFSYHNNEGKLVSHSTCNTQRKDPQ